MNDSSFSQDRVVLTHKNDTIYMLNDYMLSLFPTKEKSYISFDTSFLINDVVDKYDDIHTLEFLNTINVFILLNLMLKLTIEVTVMLLRNIDQSPSLCNNTRLILSKIGKYVLEGNVIVDSKFGMKIYISKLSSTPSNFKFQRRQFSLHILFAMTINKSQRQFLKRVGVYLIQPIISYEQLYVVYIDVFLEIYKFRSDT
uniref:DNA helicase Pif1-like 2B domain-containing protein n=1 Tax=Cajanus cajan TaxID=3821 RepID=A0A151SDX2_CAJCA|nr:hypothetical protein KK1_025132 [Cajanus cajan]